jgi:hypothetical protein
LPAKRHVRRETTKIEATATTPTITTASTRAVAAIIRREGDNEVKGRVFSLGGLVGVVALIVFSFLP